MLDGKLSLLRTCACRVVFHCIRRDTARGPQLSAKLRPCQQTYLTHAKHERSLLDVSPLHNGLHNKPPSPVLRGKRQMASPGPIHRRARSLLLAAWSPPHIRAMASSSMRKLRKTGAVDQDGNVVTIPRLPSLTGAHKPPGWNRWSAAEKVEHLLSMSLDRMHDYLSWPADSLDPYRLPRRRRSSASLRWLRPRSGEKLPASAIGNAPSASL